MKKISVNPLKWALALGFVFFVSACADDLLAEAPEEKAPPADIDSKIGLQENFQRWKDHYNVDNPHTKLTDDRGRGYEDLYGTRNFRVVLHGVYYRGGGNNKYHRTNPRSNMNPLPNDGLENLCEEGFSRAIYFYTTNFDKAPQQVNCGSGQLDYLQITASKQSNHEALLRLIYQRIKGELDGPIYGHCWNGWHASGLIASLALRQFCDLGPDQAEAYWRRNTDGNDNSHTSLIKQLRNFVPLPDLQISAEEKALICPHL